MSRPRPTAAGRRGRGVEWPALWRRLRLPLLGLGVLVGLGIVWVLVTGLLAKQEADRIENRLQQVRVLISAGRLDEARQVAKPLPAMAEYARRLTTGPAWWVSSHVPGLGSPLRTTREVFDVVGDIGSHAVPGLLDVSAAMSPEKLRMSGDTVELGPIEQARPELDAAAAAFDRSVAKLDAVPDSWLSAVDDKRDALRAQLAYVGGYVDAAARASRVLPDVLGADGPKRYFIGLQNEAEMRGTGGLPGAFAIATAEYGTVTFRRFETDQALMPAKSRTLLPTGLDFGSEYEDSYGQFLPTSLYVNSNVSPQFPYAARIWAAMYEKVSGEHIDGVLAVDPTALSYFLGATGPTSTDGQELTAQNVVPLTERDQYAMFADNDRRKAFVVGVLKAVAGALTSGRGRASSIVTAASTAAAQHRLLMWSPDSSVQTLLAQTSYAGVLPDDDQPFAGVVLNNAAAGKLDYYLSRSVTYSRRGCGATSDVVSTIELTNSAPAQGLPAYVTTRLDPDHPKDARPGDSRTLLDYYATKGAVLRNASIDGKNVGVGLLTVAGRPVYRLDIELPRGTTQTVRLVLAEPRGNRRPTVWEQPGVVPLAASVDERPC